MVWLSSIRKCPDREERQDILQSPGPRSQEEVEDVLGVTPIYRNPSMIMRLLVFFFFVVTDLDS